MKKYETTGNTTLFDREDKERKLSEMGDTRGKLVLAQEVTAASVHDSQPTDALLRESDKGQPLFADSACVG